MFLFCFSCRLGELTVRGHRKLWTLLITAVLVFAASVVAQGWLIVRAHGGALDLAYLNKRLDEHVIITTPVVTAYFLIAYAILGRIRRRRAEPLSLRAACGAGAGVATLPAAILLMVDAPQLAILAIALGVIVFGWVWVILTGGGEAGLRRGLHVSAILSLGVGLVFTLWLVATVLWRDLGVAYFAARHGPVAYAPIAVVGVVWLAASSGVVLGVCSLGLFLARATHLSAQLPGHKA
jgi:hypothetical protein